MFVPSESPYCCSYYETGAPRNSSFAPYVDNGGTTAAIAGDDFVVIAADTRISAGYIICTRKQTKLFRLTNTTVLGSQGCWCDIISLTTLINARMYVYQLENNKPMSTQAAAQMLSIMLYYKRFFPYYVANILVGLDSDGQGCVYSYDPVGHCEESWYTAVGTSGHLMQPVLDNLVGCKNMPFAKDEGVSLKRAMCILKDAFVGAAERDIYTGDRVIFNIVTKNGIKEEYFNLRKD